jgi:hypothetical protein
VDVNQPPSLRGKPNPNGYKPSRLRVHEACQRPDDEPLGFSAPSNRVVCPRCSEPISGTAAVVQRWS